jgi:hypothetical protein
VLQVTALANLLGTQAASSGNLLIVTGQTSGLRSHNRILPVRIVDESGQPVVGARVTFSLPAIGRKVVFSNNAKNFTTVTDHDGKAAAIMKSNRVRGILGIHVLAEFQGSRAVTAIVQVSVSESRVVEPHYYPSLLATARDFLVRSRQEQLPNDPLLEFAPGAIWQRPREDRGYGLYSYILFSVKPDVASFPKYRSLLASYLTMFTPVRSYMGMVPQSQLNITYVPQLPYASKSDKATFDMTYGPHLSRKLEDKPAEGADALAEAVLRNYDYVQAAVLMDRAGVQAGGPLIVSSLTPLNTGGRPRAVVFLQDLSWVPPSLMPLYLREFERVTSQGAPWHERSIDRACLMLRTIIENIALEQKVAVSSVGDFIRVERVKR